MRLLFFGSGAFGLPTLRALAARHTIVAIVTQPDRPAGRGGRTAPTPVAAWAAEHLPHVPVLKPHRISDPAVVAQVRALGAHHLGGKGRDGGRGGADAWVVIAYGQKLPRDLLEGVFAINLHASLLPRWRGASPINAAILAGDTETGNSVITVADRMDAGLILAQSRRPIGHLTTAGELHDALAADGPALVEQVLAAHQAGTLAPRPQDPAQVTIAGKLSRQDAAIDFNQPADFCRRQIHALNPWPGVAVRFQGRPLRLLRAVVAPQPGQQPTPPTIGPGAMTGDTGRIIDPAAGLVACGRGTILQLLEVQPAGKRPMPWPDFARGRAITPGERLEPLEPEAE
jgi:methionyl-tRNA formyltransferase